MVTTSKSMHREVQIKPSKSMHREVQIKHDLMTRKEKTNSIYIVFTTATSKFLDVIKIWNTKSNCESYLGWIVCELHSALRVLLFIYLLLNIVKCLISCKSFQ